jgi:rhodanese-related sulfurtransferase
MRLRLKWMIIAAAVAAAAAAYAELVLDIRTPRASLSEVHGITSSVAIPLGDYQEAMKKKYGPNAHTVFMNRPPRAITSVGRKIVEEDNTPGKFSDARGVFVIGQRGHLESTFPFEIDPRVPPISGSVGKPSAQYLRTRFGGNFPAKYLQFDDRDVLTDKCVTISPADLGWFGEALRFRGGVFCVVFWKGASPSSMLIGVALADGDPWMRPFNRRIAVGSQLPCSLAWLQPITSHCPIMPPACRPIAPIARARPRSYRRGCMKYVEMAPWLS